LFASIVSTVLANVLLVLFVAMTFIILKGDGNSSFVLIKQAIKRLDYKDVFAGKTGIYIVLTFFYTLIESLFTTLCACFLA